MLVLCLRLVMWAMGLSCKSEARYSIHQGKGNGH